MGGAATAAPGFGRDTVPRAVHEIPECQLADCIMSVAEARSVEDLGAALNRSIGRLTGSPTTGLYLLENEEPQLLYSRHVPEGFLDDYRTGLGKCDPLIDSIRCDRRAVDGATLVGSRHWRRSAVFKLLDHWGFSYNMCGPLCFEDRVVGVIYTATRDSTAPYTSALRDRMDRLCRAGSLSLTNMMRAGHLHGQSNAPATACSSSPAPSLPAISEILPPRSAEVAFRVCRGYTNKEIARQMGISDQTVKEHVANLCKRFRVHNRTELVACMLGGKPCQ
jgi:DNA-binding CsgD family transcriptional regulator